MWAVRQKKSLTLKTIPHLSITMFMDFVHCAVFNKGTKRDSSPILMLTVGTIFFSKTLSLLGLLAKL